MATGKRNPYLNAMSVAFPINRRHQRMATLMRKRFAGLLEGRFQSIGVTKEWRQAALSAE